MTPSQTKALRVGQRVKQIIPHITTPSGSIVRDGTVAFVGHTVIKVEWDEYGTCVYSFWQARNLHIMAEASHAS